ncbi:MAG TPA: aspartate--tRNA ligase, partial [Elusimicrobiales bacterium]|nr:aspartate--tRNA ligase [Elusimicrobiales bacterium]
MKRTNYCGLLTEKQINKKVMLFGWVHSWRNHGGVLFIDLRDKTGIIQITADPKNKETFKIAEKIRNEYVISVCGNVQKRPEGYVNKNLSTGALEVTAESVEILNTCKDLPLEIDGHYNVTEETRLKYRYIDLRKPRMIENMTVRHKVAQVVRQFLDKEGFLEIETPVLTRSTPEGARDYLVPSRVNKGKFYALPQSPQMFKQILMVSGMDKYFQFARAYRDEDMRADRQPEHTQVDIEMSFVEQDDIFKLMENMMQEVFSSRKEKISAPFMQMDYAEAMRKYGTDKPDLRYEMEITDVTDIFAQTKFKVFSGNLKSGNVIRALKADNSPLSKGGRGDLFSETSECTGRGGGGILSRGDIDKLTELVKKHGAKGLVWLKVTGSDAAESPTAKFFTQKEITDLIKRTNAKKGDILFLGSDKKETASIFMGALRNVLIKKLELKPDKKWAFLWVKNFPLLECGQEQDDKGKKIYISPHNPFTAPLEKDIPLLDTDPLKVNSHQYDLVLNGVEIASGSIRNHKRAMQESILK